MKKFRVVESIPLPRPRPRSQSAMLKNPSFRPFEIQIKEASGWKTFLRVSTERQAIYDAKMHAKSYPDNKIRVIRR